MALQFHNKVTHTMYSPTWIINIRIVCAAKLKSIFPFINFIEDFRFIIFVFFFQAKFSTHRQKDRFYTKQKIISHFFFLRALTFYFLINLFIAIQFDYFILNVITFLFDSRPAFCFISLFNKMIYPSTKASNLFLLPLRFCLLNIF